MWLIVFIVLVQFFANFIKGLAGFGSGVISSPILALAMDNATVTPVNSLMDLPVNAFIAFRERKFYKVKALIPYSAAMLCGIIPGTLLLKFSPPGILKIILGAVVVFIGIKMLLTAGKPPRPRHKAITCIICAVSGVTAGIFGINMFFLPTFQVMAKSHREFRGSICFLFAVDNFVRVSMYAITAMISLEVLKYFAFSAAAAFAGVLVAGRVERFIKEETAKKLAMWVFIAAGAVIILKVIIFG